MPKSIFVVSLIFNPEQLIKEFTIPGQQRRSLLGMIKCDSSHLAIMNWANKVLEEKMPMRLPHVDFLR